MKILVFCFAVVFLCSPGSLLGRQYDVGHFMECLESGNQQAVADFFSLHPKIVSKKKHLVEFIELLREEIERKYGYSPTWKDLYQQFNANCPALSMKKHDKQEIKKLLKAISDKTKKLETGHFRTNAFSFDYKGEVDFNEKETEPTIATTEAIVGTLLMLIDTPYTRGAGTFLLTDASSKYISYWLTKKSEENKALRLEQERSSAYDSNMESGCKQSDFYDRSFDSEVR